MGGRADLWLGACPRVSRLLRAVFGRSVCRARTRRSQSATRKQTISHAGAPPTPLILLVLRPPVVGLYTYINFRLTSPIHTTSTTLNSAYPPARVCLRCSLGT